MSQMPGTPIGRSQSGRRNARHVDGPDDSIDAVGTSEWHVVRGELVDTDTAPDWRRTGYRYFPYAAVESGHTLVVRMNHCFPEHALMTLFIDGRVVAEATASADDTRPLLASLARLPMGGRAVHCSRLHPADARAAVEQVAAFVVHGSEWDDPCDLCEFADRDPYGRDAADSRQPAETGEGS